DQRVELDAVLAAGLGRDQALDHADELKGFQDKFSIPMHGAGSCIYLCGNSLGLMPAETRRAISDDLEAWAHLGVEGHFHAKHPWLPAHEPLRGPMSRLVGAGEREVVAMNSLTVNLHLMMASFYRPTRERYKIVIEDAAFPSDSYAVQSQANLRGFAAGDAVVRLRPREGESTLRTEDVVDTIGRHAASVALVMLGGVNYLSGQLMDIPAITKATHAVGAVAGWDLAHAAGNAELRLHDWGADFACWCSYKYLNSGPGAVAGCFVHERHAENLAKFGERDFLPRLAGWWGNDPATRFAMGPEFVPVDRADAWSMSNPPILALTPVRVSLEIFDKVGMAALRQKSRRLTDYLQGLIDAIPGSERAIRVITPRDFRERGCQFSLAVLDRGREFHQALTRAGVACDFREPNVVRVAPAPLYNTFHDCWRFAGILREHLAKTTA
ncbi:MAG: kynureninase, partial [Phycisphaerales bacterium]|nr:kynureninase [Phycisphaerales bacterium]